MNRTLALPIAATLIVTGCTLAPPYQRPEMPPTPTTWPTPPDGGPGAGDLGLAGRPWQELFTDQRLRDVIQLALESNHDLRVAALNAEKIQAVYRIQRAELYPGAGVMATGEIYRLPEEMSENGQSETVEQYSIQLGVLSWEPDFFGRLHSLEQSALEQFLATEEARNATQISLVAGVVSTYLSLGADLESLELARSTLTATEASFDLIRQSMEVGIASDLDVAQAQSQVDATRVVVAQLTGQVALDRNSLELLVGRPIATELLPAGLHAVSAVGSLPAELPSEVLLGRPDILMAEHQLKAANANIGAARAAFFPRISLTAGIGTMSTSLDALLGSGSGTWTFAPQLITPIFAGGALKGNLEASMIEREIAITRYEKAIQLAFREVSDALILHATLTGQRDAQEALVRDLERALQVSDIRYREGLDGYLDVLVAERSLFSAQQELIRVRLAEQVNLVTLYKALGGGGE